jgi:hypothetical protein
MSKDFQVFKDEGLIELIYNGGVTPEDFIEDRCVGEKLCGENGISKILVDFSKVSFLPSTLSLFNHGASLAKSSILGNLKYAIVANETITTDINFFEAVSQNRGVNLRYFKTKAEALAWLNATTKKNADNSVTT